jgi:pimeloyl-ACP methyl ester carboxylesterase
VTHQIYLSPGMFGFTRLASYDYFGHVERALRARFEAAGESMETHICDVLPTASVRRRAATLAELVARTSRGDGHVHLLGHSTGGLDARLVASPSSRIPVDPDAMRWLPRLRSVTTMNTPHYGTPLASFFATSKGQQVLYAMSAFTVIGLSLGARPLGMASVLIGLLGRGDLTLGFTIPILEKRVEKLLKAVDDARDPGVRNYLRAIQKDQGAMLQLSPEAMDLMIAGFQDRPDVAYQSTVSMSPAASPMKWARTITHPWQTASLSLFTALHLITSSFSERYPCGAIPADPRGRGRDLSSADEGRKASEHKEAILLTAFGESPDLHANDGCVPVRSQLWGSVIWAGFADHLDVLGHYRDDSPEVMPELRHHDWLTSGSNFDDRQFDALMDAIAAGMLRASA